jgi:hypothetical protein
MVPITVLWSSDRLDACDTFAAPLYVLQALQAARALC